MTTAIGILGNGQLAKMLLPAAKKLGVPAFALGEITPGTLKALFSRVSHVLFENEFLDCAMLRNSARGTKVEFMPKLEVLELVQDKLEQKKLLEKLKIATAPFKVLATPPAQASSAVLKWSRMGYDGKGVLLCDATTRPRDIQLFFSEAKTRGAKVYSEERIAFRRELAIVAARSTTGEFCAYPLVISEQENGICKKVYGPATSLGVDTAIEKTAVEWARQIAEHLQLVGAFALEFFEDPARGLLVNEIAPRVHNSGHYTLDGCETSQFENHVRACLGMALGKTTSAPVFAMINLLGPGAAAAPSPATGVHVHWYGKTEVRPRRKMGHLNAVGRSISELSGLLSKLEACDKVWASRK